MQKIKNEQGITLLILVITIIILILVSVPVIVNTKDVMQLQKYTYFKEDIDKLREAIRTAYVDEDSISNIGPKYTGDLSFLNSTQNGETVKNPNDDENYFVISLKELNSHINSQIELKYGEGNKKQNYEAIDGKYEYQGNDTYIINARTKTIYYTDGISYKSKIYYRLPEEFTEISEIFVVTYDANGGEYAPDMQTVKATGSDTIEIRESAIRQGYTFKGWKEENGEGIFQPGETYTVKQNVTLIAQWEEDKKIDEITIPKGFYYVGGNKEGGIVISDNQADERKYAKENYPDQANIPADGLVGNQFVWVPVENDVEFKRYPSYGVDLIQSLSSYNEPSQKEYRYPGELEEYNNMVESVKKNKGFFVARFEAGNDNGNVAIKKGVMPWENIPWGNSMTSIGTTGAVAKSKAMYTDKSKYGVTSTLIYGIQWDAIMAWIDPAYKTSSCNTSSSFVANSSGKGNYTGVLKICGSSDEYRIKNIYDLAGNVCELTMETYFSKDKISRVGRGGLWNFSDTYVPASYRDEHIVEEYGNGVGFRTALYL